MSEWWRHQYLTHVLNFFLFLTKSQIFEENFFLIPITKKFYPSTLKKTHLQNQDIILTNMTQWFHEISPEVPRLLKTKSIITSCSTYVGSSTLFLLILELIRIIRCSIGLIAQHCKEFDKNHRIRQRCRKCFTNFVLFFPWNHNWHTVNCCTNVDSKNFKLLIWFYI